MRTVEEIQAAMQAIVDTAEAETRALNDEEITNYESLEGELESVKKTQEIQKRQKAYGAPTIIRGTSAKGDEALDRAFDHYLRTGQKNMDIAELRAQSTDTTEGGYMVPAGFQKKLTDTIASFGGIRSVANVINTGAGNTITWPTLDDTSNSGTIVDESAVYGSGADLVFGQKSLGAFKYTSAGASNLPLRVSVELLQDSAFDVAGLVSRKLGERIARAQAADFAQGVGTTEPTGLFTTTSDETDAGTTVTYAKLRALYHDVDPAYRAGAVWVMSDSTLLNGVRASKTKLAPAEIIRKPVPNPRRTAESPIYGRWRGNMPSRNPAAITRYRPALGGGVRKFNSEPVDALTMLAHSRASVPVTREANDTTTRSFILGPSTNRI